MYRRLRNIFHRSLEKFFPLICSQRFLYQLRNWQKNLWQLPIFINQWNELLIDTYFLLTKYIKYSNWKQVAHIFTHSQRRESRISCICDNFQHWFINTINPQLLNSENRYIGMNYSPKSLVDFQYSNNELRWIFDRNRIPNKLAYRHRA